MMMHRFCCCFGDGDGYAGGGGCNNDLQITLSGVDAGICGGCIETGAGTYLTIDSLSVDGTYLISNPVPATVCGRVGCTWQSQNVAGASATYTQHGGNASCANPSPTVVNADVDILVFIDGLTGKVAEINVRLDPGLTLHPFWFGEVGAPYCAEEDQAAWGVWIPNRTCINPFGSGAMVSGAGSALVERP